MQNPMIAKRGGGSAASSLLGSRPGGGLPGGPSPGPRGRSGLPLTPPMPPTDGPPPLDGGGLGDRIRTKLDTAVDEAASYFESNYDIATDSGIAAFEAYLNNPADVLSDLSRILASSGGSVSGLKADEYLRGSSGISEDSVSPISDMPSKLGPKPPGAAPRGIGAMGPSLPPPRPGGGLV